MALRIIFTKEGSSPSSLIIFKKFTAPAIISKEDVEHESKAIEQKDSVPSLHEAAISGKGVLLSAYHYPQVAP